MKTRCINLRDHEVRGLLDGSITALWRPVKGQESPILSACPTDSASDDYEIARWVDNRGQLRHPPRHGSGVISPYGQPGDVLIGKEAHAFLFHAGGKLDGKDYNIYCESSDHGTFDIRYRADNLPVDWDEGWRSGPSMPQWASRIRRELVAVECRQVQTLGFDDFVAMGYIRDLGPADIEGFRLVQYQDGHEEWDSPAHGDGARCHYMMENQAVWDRNDWFWKLTLKSE